MDIRLPRFVQRVHSTPKDGKDSALLRKGDSQLLNLELSQFFSLFAYVDSPRFDLASEAFATFRELLLRFFLSLLTRLKVTNYFIVRHKVLSNEFLQKNFDNFFYMFNKKLVSENFVTKK